jgi:prophage regulatory protein
MESRKRVVMARGLREKGITFSRVHIHRLVAAGKFPRPFKLGDNTNAWWEHQIDAWLDGRAAAGGIDEAKTAKAREAAKASALCRQGSRRRRRRKAA